MGISFRESEFWRQLLNCCAASVASEQQHNQDLRRLGYLEDSNAAVHSVDSDISYAVIHLPAAF